MRKILALVGGGGDAAMHVEPSILGLYTQRLDTTQCQTQRYNVITRICRQFASLPFLTHQNKLALNALLQSFANVLEVMPEGFDFTASVGNINRANLIFSNTILPRLIRERGLPYVQTHMLEIKNQFARGAFNGIAELGGVETPDFERLTAELGDLSDVEARLNETTAILTNLIAAMRPSLTHFPAYLALLDTIEEVIAPGGYTVAHLEATIAAFNALDYSTVQPHNLYDEEAEQANHNVIARLAVLKARYTSPYTDPNPDDATEETEYEAMKTWARSIPGKDHFIELANSLLARPDTTIVEMEDLLSLLASPGYYKRVAKVKARDEAFSKPRVYRDLIVAEEMASDAVVAGEEEPAGLTAVSRKARRVIDKLRSQSVSREPAMDDLIERLEASIAEKRQVWGLWSRALGTRAKTGFQRFASRSHDQLNPYARQVAALRHSFAASPVSFVSADNILTRLVDSAAGFGVDYVNFLMSQFLMGDASPYTAYYESLGLRAIVGTVVSPIGGVTARLAAPITTMSYEAYQFSRQAKITPIGFAAGMAGSLTSQLLFSAVSSMVSVKRPLPELSARPTAAEIRNLQDTDTERSQITQIIAGVASPIVRRGAFHVSYALLSNLFPGPIPIIDISSITVERNSEWALGKDQEQCPLFVYGHPVDEVGPVAPAWLIGRYADPTGLALIANDRDTCSYYRVEWSPNAHGPFVLGPDPFTMPKAPTPGVTEEFKVVNYMQIADAFGQVFANALFG
jgi:hypothetical protein